jgi:flagellar basal body-associated protein FliL
VRFLLDPRADAPRASTIAWAGSMIENGNQGRSRATIIAAVVMISIVAIVVMTFVGLNSHDVKNAAENNMIAQETG